MRWQQAKAAVLLWGMAPFVWGGQPVKPCAGTQVSFEQQASRQVAEDTLQVDFYGEKQASTIQQLNQALNRLTEQVSWIKNQLPEQLRLQSTQWRTWPVYEKGRLRIVAWRGRIGYRLTGPLKGEETIAAMKQLQKLLAVQQLMPMVSAAKADEVRGQLERELLSAAQKRLSAVAAHLHGTQAYFAQITLRSQALSPVPVRMLNKAMATMQMPAPKIEGGTQAVSVTGHFEGCVVRSRPVP